MKIMVAFVCFLLVGAAPTQMSAAAAEEGGISINGIRLGDEVRKIQQVRREGRCEGAGRSLTECVVTDRQGVKYEILEGRVLRISVTSKTAAGVKLPFGIRVGGGVAETMRLVFSSRGGEAFITPVHDGFSVGKLIKDPAAEYEFEFELRFDREGDLVEVGYKDVI